LNTNKGCDQKGNLLPNVSQHKFIFEIMMKVKLKKWPITKHHPKPKHKANMTKKLIGVPLKINVKNNPINTMAKKSWNGKNLATMYSPKTYMFIKHVDCFGL
jgi:hypothetical protein